MPAQSLMDKYRLPDDKQPDPSIWAKFKPVSYPWLALSLFIMSLMDVTLCHNSGKNTRMKRMVSSIPLKKKLRITSRRLKSHTRY
jgi:hypothetical protein